MNKVLGEVVFSGIVAVRDRLLQLPAPLRLESGEPSFDTPAHIKEAMVRALSDNATLRDYDPKAFLTNLLWNTRGERQCFQLGPNSTPHVIWDIAKDPNAQVSVISGAWAIPLFQSNRAFGDLRREAAHLQKIETGMLDALRSPYSKCRKRIWTMAEFVESPMEAIQVIVDEIGFQPNRRLTEAPKMVDLTGFGQFLQNLKNQGMHPYLMGDFPADPILHSPVRHTPPPRPYLVKK